MLAFPANAGAEDVLRVQVTVTNGQQRFEVSEADLKRVNDWPELAVAKFRDLSRQPKRIDRRCAGRPLRFGLDKANAPQVAARDALLPTRSVACPRLTASSERRLLAEADGGEHSPHC